MEEKGCKFKYVSPLSSKVIRCLDRSRYNRFPITRTFMREIKKKFELARGSSKRGFELSGVNCTGTNGRSYHVLRSGESTGGDSL